MYKFSNFVSCTIVGIWAIYAQRLGPCFPQRDGGIFFLGRNFLLVSTGQNFYGMVAVAVFEGRLSTPEESTLVT